MAEVRNPCPNCGNPGRVTLDGSTAWCDEEEGGYAYPSDSMLALRAAREAAEADDDG